MATADLISELELHILMSDYEAALQCWRQLPPTQQIKYRMVLDKIRPEGQPVIKLVESPKRYRCCC